MKLVSLAFLGLLVSLVDGQTPPSNLPVSAPGSILTVQASVLIDAPIETAWNVLLDFQKYPEWNPFVRSQVVADSAFIPLTDQTPHENLRLIIEAQIPPLPSPVNANTPPNLLHSQVSFENITTIDLVNHRAAWRQIMIPTPLLGAERWRARSTYERKTYYEAKEVFYGALGYVLDALFADGLQCTGGGIQKPSRISVNDVVFG